MEDIASPKQVAAPSDDREHTSDPAAVLTIVVVATLALILAWMLPWWIMKARAPQYGQRILVIDVGPHDVNGDVHEIDNLGHYVGIPPMGGLAHLERTMAPVGLGGALLGMLLAPWMRRRSVRL